MLEIIQFFQEHGPGLAYFILFLGSLVEGESIVLSASILAGMGYLYFPYVLGIAFFTTLFADQTLFHVGRLYGPGLLARRPQWKPKIDKIFYHLHRHSVTFILSFRFIYGIRTLSPLVIGASGISTRKFAPLNLLAAMIWATLSCGLGYWIGHEFGDEIEAGITALMQRKTQALIGLVVIFAALGLFLYWRSRRKNNANDVQPIDQERQDQ
ncbi:MAG: DedA family protein [Holosporales bacterium]